MRNILVIGAHYDDAELGCGGTMARLAREGANVYKLTLTDNETNFTQKDIRVSYEDSAAQSAKACSVLGTKEIDFEPVKCNQLFYSTELMQKVESYIYIYNVS